MIDLRVSISLMALTVANAASRIHAPLLRGELTGTKPPEIARMLE